MGVLIASIPYKSQYDADADEHRNDCGPASLAMMLAAYGVQVSTNAVYRKTGTKNDGYVSIGNLMRAAESYGHPLDFFHSWTMQKLKAKLSEGRPLMVLVHYGAWSKLKPGSSTQSRFEGPHFLLVVGYDDQCVYVNDPLWKDDRRIEGFRKAWTHDEFYAAWSSCHEDGNRDCQGIYPRKALATVAFGSGGWAAAANFQPDAEMGRRIRAWALSQGLKEPMLDSPATLNAYQSAMGAWGRRRARHVVAQGEDLGTLALKYYGDPLKWRVILAYNGLTPTDTIYDGDVLYIPEALDQPLRVRDAELRRGGTFRHYGTTAMPT